MSFRKNQNGQRAILDDETPGAVIRDRTAYQNTVEPGRANPRRTGRLPGRAVWPNRRRVNDRSGGAASGA